jgi:hypothetical protein
VYSRVTHSYKRESLSAIILLANVFFPLQALPLELDMEKTSGKDSTRSPSIGIHQLYSKSMLGSYVQLFALDYRRGYLGKDQVTWLTDNDMLSNSLYLHPYPNPS